jgi:hypothetical protein
MDTTRDFRSVLLLAGVLALAACATPTDRTPLLEKKFQRAAKHYQKFQHEGQVVYCRKDGPNVHCLTEPQLRRQVESYERNRNAVSYARIPPG